MFIMQNELASENNATAIKDWLFNVKKKAKNLRKRFRKTRKRFQS